MFWNTIKPQDIYGWLFPPEAPDEKTAWLYFLFFRLFNILVPSPVKRALDSFTTAIAPDVPEAFTKAPKKRTVKRAFVGGALVALIACLVVQGVWTYAEGTFSGNDPSRYYFIEDKPNLINYTLIVPLYVGFGCMLIVVSLEAYASIRHICNGLVDSSPMFRLPRASLLLVTCVVIAISAAITINYIGELLDPTIYPLDYWFITDIAQSGERLIGKLGIYYILVTFSLSIFSLSSIFIFFSIFIMTITVGRAFTYRSDLDVLTIDQLREQLGYFSYSAVIAKAVAAVFMMNAFTWRFQHATSSLSFQLFVVALLFFGVFVISIPRYYIEVEWYRLKVMKALKSHDTADIEYNDLRPRKFRILSMIIDATIISIFVSTFWPL